MLQSSTYLRISKALLDLLVKEGRSITKDEKRILGTIIFNAMDKLKDKTHWEGESQDGRNYNH